MKLKMRRYGDYQSDNTGVGDTGQTVVLRYAMIRRIRENRTKIGKIEEKYRSNGANYLKWLRLLAISISNGLAR